MDGDLRRDILMRRFEAAKHLRTALPDELPVPVEEIIREFELSGLSRAGCPRCGESFFWVNGFIRVCSYCFYLDGVNHDR